MTDQEVQINDELVLTQMVNMLEVIKELDPFNGLTTAYAATMYLAEQLGIEGLTKEKHTLIIAKARELVTALNDREKLDGALH